jgi:CRP-like cAMP-binding protein/Zn-dependent protease
MDFEVPIILAVLVLVAGVIVVDGVRQRRRRASIAIDVRTILAGRLAAPSTAAVVPGALRRALADRSATEIGLFARLGERLDPAAQRPKLRDGCEVQIFRLRWGNDYAMIARSDREMHFHLEVWEAQLLPKMDGTRTVADLVVEQMEAGGGLDAESITDLVGALAQGGFLDPVPIPTDELLAARLDPASEGRKKLRRFGKTLSIEWKGAERLVAAAYRYVLKPFFWWPVTFVTAIVTLVGFIAFLEVNSSGRFSLSGTSAPAESAILLGLSFFLTFMHELGHAAVLVHYKRHVKSAGFMIYFGSPAFFVEATDSLMLSRRQRILQSFAGPFTEMILAGIASIALWAFPDGPTAGLLYKFAFLNYFVIFLNLIPLLELDGYWILSDLIQVPDLRPRSLQFIQHDLWHKIKTRERLTPQEWGLGGYGIAGIAFTILTLVTGYFFWKEIFGELVISLWNGGPGTRVLLVLLLVFLGGPVVRGALNLLRTVGRRLLGVSRGIRFKRETGWRIEAARLIDALPAFEDLPEEVLSDLAGRVKLRIVRPGEPVFRQGDRPTAFFIVRRGLVQIEDEDPEIGDTRVIRTMGPGESFGELALLGAHRRQATVRAADEVELFEIDKSTFDRLLAEDMRAPEFGHTMQSLVELRELPVFRGLDASQLHDVLEHGGWITVPPGSQVVTEGDPGDAFYAVVSGRADVMRDGRVLKTMAAGTYFGEVALLRDVPRTATVVARTAMRLFRLDREGFDRVIADAFRRGTLRPAADRTWQH